MASSIDKECYEAIDAVLKDFFSGKSDNEVFDLAMDSIESIAPIAGADILKFRRKKIKTEEDPLFKYMSNENCLVDFALKIFGSPLDFEAHLSNLSNTVIEKMSHLSNLTIMINPCAVKNFLRSEMPTIDLQIAGLVKMSPSEYSYPKINLEFDKIQFLLTEPFAQSSMPPPYSAIDRESSDPNFITMVNSVIKQKGEKKRTVVDKAEQNNLKKKIKACLGHFLIKSQ